MAALQIQLPLQDSTDPGLQEKLEDEIGLAPLAGIGIASARR
jgi:hypothetical protein